MKTFFTFKDWRDFDFRDVDKYVYETILQAVSEAVGEDNDKYREIVQVVIAAYRYGKDSSLIFSDGKETVIAKKELTKEASPLWHTEEPEPDRRVLAITAGDRAVVYYVYPNHWEELKKDVVKWCYIDDLLRAKRKV